jgi:hypothetical protein
MKSRLDMIQRVFPNLEAELHRQMNEIREDSFGELPIAQRCRHCSLYQLWVSKEYLQFIDIELLSFDRPIVNFPAHIPNFSINLSMNMRVESLLPAQD